MLTYGKTRSGRLDSSRGTRIRRYIDMSPFDLLPDSVKKPYPASTKYIQHQSSLHDYVAVTHARLGQKAITTPEAVLHLSHANSAHHHTADTQADHDKQGAERGKPKSSGG